jgi:dipeptidyl aminopeptidase/acylaminoacyl peptidase
VDTFSNLTSPPRTIIHDREGAQAVFFCDADSKQLNEYQLLPTEIVCVKASDDAQLYRRLIKPPGFAAGRKSAVIVIIYCSPHAQTVRKHGAALTGTRP